MDLVKKLAIGTATIAVALSSVTPAFAAKAVNKNIGKNSFATAIATENTTYNVGIVNEDNVVVGVNLVVANSGFVYQANGKNSDGNTLKTGDAQAQGFSKVEANKLVLIFK